MKRIYLSLLIISLIATGVKPMQAEDAKIQQFLSEVGIPVKGTLRGQMDIIGFASTPEQMESVVKQSSELAKPQWENLKQKYNWNDETVFKAGICPHDDYYYASRLYSLIIPRIKAKRVIIFGVFHKARFFGMENVLVIDGFEKWRGPKGSIMVSSLREEITARLRPESFTVDNDAQMVEHSVEPIAYFLQAYNPEVEIVSILVPHMDWKRMTELSDELSWILAEVMRANNWKLGKDVAIICSADAVHYGDAGWGGSNYAEFGTDISGYDKAVQRDIGLAENFLSGKISDDKLRGFLYTCADSEDIKQYKITWCGRFSIPLGLLTANGLAVELEGKPLEGYLLDYGTSVSEISLDLQGLEPLGVTAPNNLHHWVGYGALGYR